MTGTETEPCAELLELVRLACDRPTLEVGGLWGASQAFVLAELTRRAQGPWLAVVASDAEAEVFAEDLRQMGADPFVYPSRGGSRGEADADAVRLRLTLAQRLAGPPAGRPRLVVAPVLALLQPLPLADELASQFVRVATGQTLDPEALVRRLVKAGFERQPLVERPGELSQRGDILDLWPWTREAPLRIELFDDEIESLRTFDPEEQTSVAQHDALELCLASDAGGVEDGHGTLILRRLAPTTVFVEVEPLRVAERAEDLRIRSASHGRALLLLRAAEREHRRIALQSLPARDLSLDVRSTQFLAGPLEELAGRLEQATRSGERALVFCRDAREAERLERAAPAALAAGRVEVREGSLSKGFRFPAAGLLAVNWRELCGIEGGGAARRRRAHYRTRALQSFFELRPGDLVVHAVHGLARFRGLERMARGGGEEEHLHLSFADDVSLYVPAARIDLVQRYIGSGGLSGGGPPLDRIGGTAFRKRKQKVERALYDLAAQLLEVQARRELERRPPWAPDSELVERMITAFPYTETDDQLEADREIGADLARPRPMDRLLCGDVGFGKTEIAVRAAFRVVSGGGQVAVLAPTTVLADQHERTFRQRLTGLPVTVAGISRYVSGKAAKETLARVAAGEVDILIGTHRLLSKDVRFRDLGLVIVDEEQRFGVTHKEHFKRYRAKVDVLSLSATPIPRTLHMSLSGLRDISALSQPPPGRQEIETRIAARSDRDTIRQALLRERNREGQVFFLHNRVDSIQARARELAQLVPECSFGVGHGQMGARELRAVMDGFARGAFDVLVATTIVENGLDIPAAGTIVIDEADRFGLSEMHQLRGRVGRGSQKAWCYLLIDETKPIRQVAKQRLKALEELTHLGAGFAISMKDLEIRGAGNLLGPEQSGHIGAVGYDMYTRLLRTAVERAQHGLAPGQRLPDEEPPEEGVELELGLRAFLPEEWIPSQETRIEILRELDAIHGDGEAGRALASLRDRFGRVPEEAKELVRQFRLRARLHPLGVRRVAWRQDAYLIEYADRVALQALLGTRRVELRTLREGLALLVVPPDRREPQRALEWLEGLLEAARPAQG